MNINSICLTCKNKEHCVAAWKDIEVIECDDYKGISSKKK